MSRKKNQSLKPAQAIHFDHPVEPLSLFSTLCQWVIAPLTMVGLAILFYRPSLNYAFQFDDLANIIKFYDIRHHTFSSLFFTGPRWISSVLNVNNYRMGAGDPFAPYYYRLSNIRDRKSTRLNSSH